MSNPLHVTGWTLLSVHGEGYGYAIVEGSRTVAMVSTLDDAKLFMAAPKMAAALAALVKLHGDPYSEGTHKVAREALKEAGL